jgi:hypothetical protein
MSKIILLVFCFFLIQSTYLNSSVIFAFQLSQKTIQNAPPDSSRQKSSAVKDSSAHRLKKEVVVPVYSHSYLSNSPGNFEIGKNEIDLSDYRFMGDLLTNVPFGFNRDLGFVGQPSEVLIYGQGFGKISYLGDGISINNRLTNSYDLNLFQSESIDSIEAIPLARSFLYGTMNNEAAINFISNEPTLLKQYSRLKFYLAPNNEGMVDAIFSINPLKKTNVYFEITHQSTDSVYANSTYSSWRFDTRIRYFLSDKVNLTASYKYAMSNIQLYSGVNIDSIKNIYSPSVVNSVLYEQSKAPVRYKDRYQKTNVNDFKLQLTANLIPDSPTELNLYHQDDLIQYRQNEYGSDTTNADAISDNNESKVTGANLRQDINLDIIHISSITNFERNEISSPLINGEVNKNIFSTAGIAGIDLLNKSFIPSGFIKYLNYSSVSYAGAGADVVYNYDKTLKLYAGLSSFEKPYNILEEYYYPANTDYNNKQKISTVNFSLSFTNSFLKFSTGYFNQSISNALMPAMYYPELLKNDTSIFINKKEISLQGLSIAFDLRIWRLHFNTNTSYYFSSQSRHDYDLPDFTSYGGIYYIDTLFHHNLKLKTGINYSSIGSRDQTIYDYEKSITSNIEFDPGSLTNGSSISSSQFSPTFQLDFFLAGKIQDRAIIYFVFQNLLNNNYFIVPYYPMQTRQIRFGVAWEFLD